jgi:hypothetical protein
MKHRVTEILAALALASAIGLIIYQHFACTDNDAWIDWEQLWHYEPFILSAIVASVALIVGKFFGKRGY